MGLTSSQIQAILSLLGDCDQDIVATLRNKLYDLGSETVLEVLDAADPNSAAQKEAARVMARFREPSVEARFRELVSGDPDLEAGVVAIARFGYPDLPQGAITPRLDQMAADLAPNIAPDDHPVRVIRTFNDFLFGRHGFEPSRGYSKNPDPDDTYLNRVLDRRRGLPISLSALYILLGRRVDVPFEGVNTPNHFLVRLSRPGLDNDEDGDILVDPFHGGRVLTRNECADVVGKPVSVEELGPVSDRRILVRMLANLVSACTARGQRSQAERIVSLMNILNSDPS